MIEPFLSAIPILDKLEKAGFEAYFVGGAVRDFLLQKPIHDIDIATSAMPEEMKAIFSNTVDIGIQHGTILVLHGKHSFEITTFRTESEYADFRHPKEVSFIRSLKKDLERRDFTINAMAMDRKGTIYDYFDGQTSLAERLIKTVGKAEERFQEDALRIMRAVRFVSQLSFGIEEKTLDALAKMGHLLEKIAVERKRAEFEKLLTGESRQRALKIMMETNLYPFLPGLKDRKKEIQTYSCYDSQELNLNEMWTLLLYCLELHEKDAEHFLREWRLSVKQMKDILHMLCFLKKRIGTEWTKFDLYTANLDTVISVEKLYKVMKKSDSGKSIRYWMVKYKELPIKQRGDLDVTGTDLLQWHDRKGGSWIQECLQTIEQAVLEGTVKNEKTNIKEWLLKCNQK